MLSLANIAKQIQEDSKNKLVIDVEHVQTKQIINDIAWVFPATYGIYPVELVVFTRLKGFVYQLVVKNPKNVDDAIACTKEKDYNSETFENELKHVLGLPPVQSTLRICVDNSTSILRKFAHYRGSKEGEQILGMLKTVLPADLGNGPTVIDQWIMDATKDDYVDFIFVVKNVYNQLPDFDIQLQLAYNPEDDNWSVYSQYIRNSDDHIFVDSSDIPCSRPDPLGNLRDYLIQTVETGNKAVELYQKHLEKSE
jgi:hypothetical protein